MRTLGWIILWIAAVIGGVFAEARWSKPRAVSAKQLDDAKVGSAALILIRDGEVVTKHGVRADPDRTRFLVASVSKAVTAWGVMKLVQDGRVALDEPVMRHLQRWRFPGSERYRERVTVRHLLSHTAGLDDGLGYGGFGPGERVQTLEESLTLAKDSTVGAPRAAIVTREPGTAMAYSGASYAVLQLLIEEVTQKPFAQYMQETVLQPLGMTTATFELPTRDLATSFDHELRPQPHRRYAAPAAVALWATPRDLAQFARALLASENPVLTRGTMEEMLRPQPGTAGTWALGHTIFAPNIAGHDGGTYPAWGAMLRVNRATGNAMILTVSGGRGALNSLGHAWIYSETGTLTRQARREKLYRRIVPASIAIVLGAIAIVLWRRRIRQ